MKYLVKWLILWPESVAAHLQPLGPPFARIVTGWVFLWSGWGKLQNLPGVTQNFIDWGIPFPHLLTPFTSGLEFVGGILLIAGLFTRIAAGGLGVVMIVAIRSALWDQVDSLETLFGFYETTALAVFFWLAIAGPGPISLDHVLKKEGNIHE